MSEEEIKIEYQEICSDPEWCIVKIVPHSDQIDSSQTKTKSGINTFWDFSADQDRQNKPNVEGIKQKPAINQETTEKGPNQVHNQGRNQIPNQLHNQGRNQKIDQRRPKSSGLNVISNNNHFTQRNINLRSHEQIESKESYDNEQKAEQKLDPFPFIREKDNIPKNTKIHPRQTTRNRYSSITLPQKEADETDRSKKISDLLASISGQ
jgi:hypothetical protein